MRTWVTIGLALGAAAVIAAVVGGDQDGGTRDMSKPETIFVSVRGDPELESLLQQMDDEFASAGIRSFSAAEVTKMRKTPGPSYAIPERSFWPRIIATLVVMQAIRDAWGKPISVYNGYRPPDYNLAVGGKPGSRHQWFEALDVLPTGDRDEFALLVAKFYIDSSDMGFGVYGKPGAVTGVHVDLHRKRTWGIADDYVRRAGAIA